jgi:hypothetical protein
MSKIIIQIQGGLVQDVFKVGSGKLTGYITVDEDAEGAEDFTTVKCKTKNDPLGKGTFNYEAVCGGAYKISNLPKRSDVARMVNKFLKEKGKGK